MAPSGGIVRGMRVLMVLMTLLVGVLAPAIASGQEPLGVVDQTLGQFDRDSLRPAGPTIEVLEPHTGPALSPNGRRIALGVSSPGSPNLPGVGRVGLWLIDKTTMTVAHEVRTGIAAEEVVFPGVVAALLQNGDLVIVDPVSGRIRHRRALGWSSCAPAGIEVAGRGVLVSRIQSNGVDLAVVDANGRVRTKFVRVSTSATGCRRVQLVSNRGRAYIVGRRSIVSFNPATRKASSHAFSDLGRNRSAAVVPGGLAVASERGVRLYDTTTWHERWRNAQGTSVLASGSTVIASGRGYLRALGARTGRTRWRFPGNAEALAAGRVYALPEIRDIKTGAIRGTHPASLTAIRLVSIDGTR